MAESVENIVIIVADALRPDKVGAYSGDNLTPNIDSVAETGEVFEECYSCINATDPSITTILTGLYPTRHGILNHGRRVTEEEQNYVSGTTPLPEIIKDTHQSVGIDTLERWHRRGFNKYENPRHSSNPGVSLLKEIGAREYLTRITEALGIKNMAKSILGFKKSNRPVRSEIISELAIKPLSDIDPPFFLFAHYWESHAPYVPLDNHPERIRNRSYEGEDIPLESVLDSIEGSPWKERLESKLTGEATTIADMKRKYDAGVWEVDQAIGKLIDSLKEQALFDKTAFIITADHGESLTEHGIFFDHHGLYDPSIHVPLLINAPGFKGRENQFVQHFDLVPTILDLLDRDFNEELFDGISLTKDGDSRTLHRDAVYMEESHTARKRAIRTKNHKYIQRLDDRAECRYCDVEHGSDEELYDLSADPQEEQNTVGQSPEVRDELNQRLYSWIDDLSEPSQEGGSFEPTDEVKNHLEEMGYL